MNIVELIRLESSNEGTFGVVRVNKEMFCVSLEPKWFGNERSISCIPTGQYTCKMVDSPSFGRVYQVLDVHGRTHILFHIGNYVENTDGCILLGQRVTELTFGRAVTTSAKTIAEFNALLKGDPFILTITENY